MTSQDPRTMDDAPILIAILHANARAEEECRRPRDWDQRRRGIRLRKKQKTTANAVMRWPILGRTCLRLQRSLEKKRGALHFFEARGSGRPLCRPGGRRGSAPPPVSWRRTVC